MAEDRVMQSLLLDFYGELLTDKQRECCELHFNEDLSLAEIAEQCGVSRQGVWDNIRRGTAALAELEETAEKLLSLLPEGQAAELAEKLRQDIRALRTRG